MAFQNWRSWSAFLLVLVALTLFDVYYSEGNNSVLRMLTISDSRSDAVNIRLMRLGRNSIRSEKNVTDCTTRFNASHRLNATIIATNHLSNNNLTSNHQQQQKQYYDDNEDVAATFPYRRRVAVCLAGLARTFILDDLRKNIQKTLIDPLKSTDSVDLFLSVRNIVRNESEYWAYMKWQPYWQNLTLPRAANMMEAIESMHPMAYEYSRIWNDDQRFYFNGVEGGRLNCRTRQYNQWQDLQTCWRLINRHELTHGFQYDFFIRARPDVSYAKSLPPITAWPNATTLMAQRRALFMYPSGSQDVFAIMTRPVARQLFYNLANELFRTCNATYLEYSNEQVWASIKWRVRGFETLLGFQRIRDLRYSIVRPCSTRGWFVKHPEYNNRTAFEKFCIGETNWANELMLNQTIVPSLSLFDDVRD